MAMMLGALYRALTDPTEDHARQAAEEVADYKTQIAELHSDLTLVKWMLGTLITLQIALGVGHLWLTLNVLARLGR